MNFFEKYSKYLPSKKFTLILSSIIVLAVIIFAIFFMSSSGELFSSKENKKNSNLKIQNQTISDLIEKDTDNDGVPDWEESLWGTDPNKKITFNDMPDATYIENKKKELNIEQSVDTQKLTETEKFAREFFSSYSAMKTSGQINNDTINNFSNELGQKIVNPNITDSYSEKDIKKATADNAAFRQRYYLEMKNLFEKYKKNGIGDELEIISKALEANETSESSSQYDKLQSIGSAYQDFAKAAMNLNVPQSLISYQLRIVNSANNTGKSIISMQKISSDPIVGLSGLSQYQKYSDDLVKAVADLETLLSQ